MYRLDHERFVRKSQWEKKLNHYVPSSEFRRVPECPHLVHLQLFECTGPTRFYERTQVPYPHPISELRWCQTDNITFPRRIGYNADGLASFHFVKNGKHYSGEASGRMKYVEDANGDFIGRFLGLQTMKPSMVRNPSNCIQFGDTGSYRFTNSSLPNGNHYATRHGTRSNIVFVDGHVESATQASWFLPTDEARRRWYNDDQPHPEMWPENAPDRL